MSDNNTGKVVGAVKGATVAAPAAGAAWSALTSASMAGGASTAMAMGALPIIAPVAIIGGGAYLGAKGLGWLAKKIGDEFS